MSHETTWKRGYQAEGTASAKALQQLYAWDSRNSKEASVARSERAGARRRVEGWSQRGKGTISCRTLYVIVTALGFTLSDSLLAIVRF